MRDEELMGLRGCDGGRRRHYAERQKKAFHGSGIGYGERERKTLC